MAAPKFQTPRRQPRTASQVLRALFADMQDRKLHIVDVATEMNMTSTGLAFWKSGRRTPDIVAVEALAQTLGYRLTLEPIVHSDN